MKKAISLVLVVFLLLAVDIVSSLQSLFPEKTLQFPSLFGNNQQQQQQLVLEQELLQAVEDAGNRLDDNQVVIRAIQRLEESSCSIPDPAVSPQIYGRWRLIYTTNTDTSSPIQRKAVDTSRFPIYQDIVVVVNDEQQLLQVNQVVQFSETAYLTVNALASTPAYPLDELQPRQGTGKILGLNILGVSLVGQAAAPIRGPNARIDFVFDQGYLRFGDWQIPYPVPFRWPLFRDAVKGWIDITYLSDRIRLARGNKGTTFVLVKEEE